MNTFHQKTLLFACIFLVLSSNVFGAKFQANNNISINEGHNEDLYLAGASVRIQAPIEGDVIAAARKVSIDDSVYADVIAAGADLEVDGWVGDDVRITSGNIYINGTIEGDLVMAGGTIDIGQNAAIKGSTIISGGSIHFDGTAREEAKISGGDIEFTGSIEGPAHLRSGALTLGGTISGPSNIAAEAIELNKDASFSNDVKYWQEGGELNISDHLQSGANAEYDTSLSTEQREQTLKWLGLGFAGMILYWFLSLLGGFVLILFLALVFRKQFENFGNVIGDHLGGSLIAGLIYIIVTPVLAIALLATIIGIPLGLLGLTLYGFSLAFARSIAAVILAYWIKQNKHYQWTNSITILVALLIFLMLKVIALIPFIGWLVNAAILVAGLGAIVFSIYMKNKPEPISNDAGSKEGSSA